MTLSILAADPQGEAALSLLRLAAVEARALYPELHAADAPWPGNEPTPPRGIYLLAWMSDELVGMGAHRPLDANSTELRRMFVRADARRHGVARALLEALQAHALSQGFTRLRLETGFRQLPAMRLYESFGFQRIDPFGPYVGDPSSVCFEKHIA
ncbi:GNAT family N-acetyltransferase [Roseateles sp.]|jgi:putative acetyltransferase|uniref:GNAT family N-acetyltransferase n=1 Tax=Roseateles sp. TaxID=1971397 RepID=UPI0037CC4C8B